MGKRKPRPWPDTPEPLASSVIDNHTHLPVHEGEIPRADGVKMPLEEQLARASGRRDADDFQRLRTALFRSDA